ncbi:unnamed protein product [Merluccius merluccius]
MLLRITVAVVVCVCSKVQPAAAERLAVPRDYGVKLCGREFIRAVIFTCGGSRWRRAQDGDSEEQREQRPKSSSSFSSSSSSSSLRKRRNFSLGVAGMCCSQGCTKNDIGRLC